VIAALVSACAPADLYPLQSAPLPAVLDADGDGFTDDLELLAGSDPTNPFDWDFGSGQWPDFLDEAKAAGIEGTGYGYGETIPTFRADDQYGGRLKLHQLYGYVVVLDFVAGWCMPCEDVAAQAQGWWVDHRLDGVIVVHVIMDDEDGVGVVDPDFVPGWADRFGLEFPVVLDDDHEALEGLVASELYQGAVPFLVVLDKQMRIDSAYDGVDGAYAAQDRALDLL
jgi:peroxiredoxin